MLRNVSLLLLLSAMLSALAGVGGTARVAQPTAAVQVAAAVVATRVTAAAVTGRPVVALPTRLAARSGPASASWQLAAPAPLYLSRRRE